MPRKTTNVQGTPTVPMLVGGLGYLVCWMAVHLSIAVVGGRTGSGSRPGYQRPRSVVVVGSVTALAWASVISGIAFVVSDAPMAAATVLAAGLPLVALITWQVAAWQQAEVWARRAGSMVLGQFSSQPFKVRRPYVAVATERLKHVSVQGPTGSGKSTLLKNLILNDIRKGSGLCVVDPKDDLIDSILAHIPPHREQDIILLDAADTERPLGFNPLSGVAAERRSLAAAELIAIFRRYFNEAWGVRLEHILTNVVLALLETPGTTLLDIPRMLLDEAFRQQVVAAVTNPGVQQFFAWEFEQVLRRRGDALEPVLNKTGPWLTYPELRNIIGQRESSFDVRQVMDAGKVLLVRIPQGQLGEQVSSLLGALIVAKVQLAAHSRVDTPSEQRRPFYLYCDEFQNFATSSFSRILTEARGFKLGLVCANQYPEQLSRDLQLALERNVATAVECVGQPGPYRVKVMRLEEARRFPDRPPRVLVPPEPLSRGDEARAEFIRELSRRQYGRLRAEVELAIALRRPTAPEQHHAARSRERVTIAPRADLDEE